MGRSAGFAVTAGVLFFLGGILFFCTKDYEGLTIPEETQDAHEEVLVVKVASPAATKDEEVNSHSDEEDPAASKASSQTAEVEPSTVVIY